MANRKYTRKALLSSVLALVLCFSTLLGTTFAWFTDSVTSAGNIIKSGTLEVTMEWANGTEELDSAVWNDASAGPIFTSTLWEPGYTEVRHVKISNKGTLALKYHLDIEANGEVSKLAEVIDVYFIDGGAQLASRDDLGDLAPVGTLAELLENITDATAGDLAAGESDIVTIALKMQETAGNDYQDLEIGSEFAIKLLAIQLSAESDSFDNTYDDGLNPGTHYVSTVDELKAAMKVGGTIVLMKDIAITEKGIAAGADVVLDLNGHTITDSTTDGRTFASQRGLSVITVTGNGSIVKDENVTSTYAMPFLLSSGTVIIENGTFAMGAPAEKDYNILAQNSSTLIINGGTFTNTANYPLLNAIWSSTVEINGGHFESIGAESPDLLDVEYHYSRISIITVKGGTFVNYNPLVDNESDRVIVPDGYTVISETKANGDVWYTVVEE